MTATDAERHAPSAIRRVLGRVDVLLFVACAVLFSVWPALDLATAGAFFERATGDFPLGDAIFIQFLYETFQYGGWIVLLGAIAGYYGRRIDDFIVWIYTTLACIPGLIRLIAIKFASVFLGASALFAVLRLTFGG